MIRSTCERCRTVLKDTDDQAGRRAACPACGHSYTVATPRPGLQINVKLLAAALASVTGFALIAFVILRSGSSTPTVERKKRAAQRRREKLRRERDEEKEADLRSAEVELEKMRDEAARTRAEREEALRRQQREEEEARRRAIEEGRAPAPPEAPR
jgi:hypothetical protein